MSLNDPHWGRGSGDKDPRNEDADRSEMPRGNNENPDEQRGSQSGDRRNGDNNGWQNGNRNDNRNDNRRPDGEDDELDRLWKEFTELWSGTMGGRKNERRRPGEGLKSRDDYSRDDEPQQPSGQQRAHRFGEDRQDDDRPEPGEKRFEKTFEINIDWPFGRKKDGKGGNGGKSGEPVKAGPGFGFILAVAVLGWCATGFYIVPEGQSGIVTTFGRYSESTAPGFRWHIPAPVQQVQLVDVSSVRTTEIGFAGRSDRLREALMLTDDENIVDVQFTVQYRIKPGNGARDYVFRIRQPELTVQQCAESAMREVVGRKTMDSVLFESKAEIAEAVKVSMQTMLDRYDSGIEVMSVAIQNAQPPQQVQAAFNDAVKAGQDRERSINLGEAYRNAVLPKAEGTAARLKEEALGYQARITETARGDADRFSALYEQYRRAPEVTRDRLYVDTVREVMKNVSKVYVDAKGGNNLLYLPLDKIVGNTRRAAEAAAQGEVLGTDPAFAADKSPVTDTPASAGTTSGVLPLSGQTSSDRLLRR